jgi:hypothetical protein
MNPFRRTVWPASSWSALLAALILCNVVTVTCALFIGYRLTAIFERSVADDSEWAARLTRFAVLRRQIEAIDDPGAEVLATRDVPQETANLNEALANFDRELTAVRADVQSITDKLVAQSLLRSLERIEIDVSQIVAETLFIFS